MPAMASTEIMTLGRIGAFEPMLRATWLQNRRVSPQQPQNLLRAVALGGVYGTARLLAGLGDVGDDALQVVHPIASELTTVSDPVAMGVPSPPRLPWQKDSPLPLGWIISTASLSLVSAAVAGYHGYRRDKSAMAGVGWGFMGALFPVITPVVAFAQGYARPRTRRK